MYKLKVENQTVLGLPHLSPIPPSFISVANALSLPKGGDRYKAVAVVLPAMGVVLVLFIVVLHSQV